jgi:hypothetical protein
MIKLDECGIIENCIDEEWLSFFLKKYTSVSPTNKVEYEIARHRPMTQINSGFVELMEMYKNYFSKIIDVKIPYHSLLVERLKPIGPHSDSSAFKNLNDPNLTHYTFLIPLSGFGKFKTIVFDQKSSSISGVDGLDDLKREFPILESKINCVDDEDLDFIDKEVKSRLSIKKKLIWSKNSILYWKGDYLHSGTKDSVEKLKPKKSLIVWTKTQ